MDIYVFLNLFIFIYPHIHALMHSSFFSYRNRKSLVNILFPPLLGNGFQMQIHSHYLNSTLFQSPLERVALVCPCHTGIPQLCLKELFWFWLEMTLKWSKFSPFCVDVSCVAVSVLHKIIHFRIWTRGDFPLRLKVPLWRKVVLIVLQSKEAEAGGWASVNACWEEERNHCRSGF